MASVALQTATALEPVAKPRESKLVIWSMAMCMLCILPLFFDKDSFSYTSNQQDGAYVHMLLEWTGVCMAAMATFMCFVQYRLSRDTFLPLIGIVLLCSGLMDAFHILAAAHLLNTQVADQDLIPFTWALTRMFNATLILIGVAVLTLKSRQQSKELRTKTFFFVSAFFLLAAFLVMDAVVSAEYLPQTLFPDEIITRPYEWLAISIILLTEIIAIPLYVKGNNSVFGAALLLLLIPSLGAELWMVFASSQLYDNAFNVAHGLKAISYIIPLLGITSAYLKSSRDQNKLSAKLTLKNEELEDQSEQLHRVSVGESFLAEFGASLNQIDETLTYYKVLSNISNLLNAPVTALYVEQEGEMVLAAIVGSDPTLEPSAETGTGLVDRVYQSRQASIIAGPFDDKNFSFSVGVGAIQFYSISAWPILYFKKCVAVLVSYNQRAVVDDEEKLLLRCLDLLAIRVINFRSEKQRNELLSDLKSERTALEISSAEAKKANQVKTDFLARMSHELRTPLNSIIGFNARLIKRLSGKMGERDYDALLTVERNSQHLLSLINDILDISKIEADKVILDLDEFDLKCLVKDVIELNYSLIDEKQLSIAFHCEQEDTLIEGDSIKIKQILTNLLANAIKFTDAGTITVQLESFIHPNHGKMARVQVQDTGIGISADDQKLLFQKFSQVDDSATRRSSGAGLGLMIAEEFAIAHGGWIDVESVVGSGSTFSLILPLIAHIESYSMNGSTNETADGSRS